VLGLPVVLSMVVCASVFFHRW